VLEPVADEEGVVLAEAAVVEDKEELATVGAQSLNGMWNARREVPEISDAEVVDEGTPLLVDGGDARVPVEHVGPLGLLVPVHLARAAGVEAHVDAGHVLGDRELAVTSRVQPPRSSRVCASAKEKRRLGRMPRSVAGGRRRSGFSRSRTTSRGPGSMPPRRGRFGCGVGLALLAGLATIGWGPH
jgi:hypothetical protein